MIHNVCSSDKQGKHACVCFIKRSNNYYLFRLRNGYFLSLNIRSR